MELDWDDPDYKPQTAPRRSSSEHKHSSRHDHRDSRRYREGRGRDKADNDASFSMSLNINGRHIGLIIGQGGSNIRQLQDNYHVRIDINKENLTATIKGKKSDVEDAYQVLRNQIAADPKNEKRNSDHNSYGSSRYGGGGDRKTHSGSYGDGASLSSYGASSSSYGNDRNGSSGNRGHQSGGYSGSSHRDGGSSYSNDGNSYRNGSSGYGNRDHQSGSSYRDGGSQHDDRKRTGDSYGKKSRFEFDGHDDKTDSNESNNPPEPANDTPKLIDWEDVYRKSKEGEKLKWSKCPHLTKDFYQEKPEVAAMSTAEVECMREENNNTMVSLVFDVEEGDTAIDIPNPVWKFEQCFDAYPDLLAEITKQGFKKPSPIQCQAWPILLKGHDMIGISQTGSGKTLAFLLPAMIHTEYQDIPRGQRAGPNVLVLAPTRELALQIESEVKKYTFRDMKAVCVYGGGNRKLQISELELGAEIIICTPGRLNDLIEAKVIDVKSITFLILDEADRMLDMGFEPQIRKVMLDIRPDRQTVMTSATWPPGVRRLAQSYMKNPIQVCIGSLDLAATHSVKQIVEILLDDNEKNRSLLKFISRMRSDDKAIIFCGRKARADALSSDLAIARYKTACIHGDRDQHDREQAISDIKSGMANILVATDIASRGLDIEDITHVINYDMPRSIEEYVHRVGRTGRAGRTGTSISYLTREDWKMARELIEILEEAKQEVPEELRNMAMRFAAMKDKRGSNMGGNRRGGYHDRDVY